MDHGLALKALANPVRREILALLKDPLGNFAANEHFPDEQGVCGDNIVLRMRLAQSTISTHLAILQRAGLVTSQKRSQWTYFQRNEKAVQEFLRSLRQEL
ncbi:ArsR/SmtB family transcription factor [Terriglobus saanensis]|uniref:Regulatory protein ArsR n=1 Tax=Terriglobus saanensis (strain ATCC BAA-1853 / DSM 23119 / SP1PR4) TaxID=401053 RepID=E8UX36_TERSS|nr:ArsR family transcriptional regulator [Terriglobus saanensis]ADV81923.1 regulatory protein ArsR [Terriglobus saanensis SP1PR4]